MKIAVKRRIAPWLIVEALLVLVFLYWVWPTPWVYSYGEGSLHRRNIFTGERQTYLGEPCGFDEECEKEWSKQEWK